MTYRNAVCFAAAMFALAGAEPALAQSFVSDAMPPGAVVGLVRSSGFEPMSRPVLQGRYYVLRAVDPVGTRVRIVVDPEMGEIMSARPLDPSAPHYQRGEPVAVPPPLREPRVAGIPPGMERAPAPYEPGMRSNGGLGSSPGMPPAGMASTPSQMRTPLPRSRPLSATASASTAPDVKPTQGQPAPAGGASSEQVERGPSAPAQGADQDASAPPKTATPDTANPDLPAVEPLNE